MLLHNKEGNLNSEICENIGGIVVGDFKQCQAPKYYSRHYTFEFPYQHVSC